ncbi:hypothetical protein KDU71_12655 [Carboxylicivirga sediminis]|uniref:Uncharacterized protein n=1 Tax=Carboxylicivirga sediminis TaxID=2006564 RepID=A0A941IXX7_9BACT|nr:hypothetical protein [Carboxylicivirga sediminis]MBR8536415.1 hypothetical protein [Carboxylicivirga sediminis]
MNTEQTENREKFLNDEYERLKSLVGKEKADKHFANGNYPGKVISGAILDKAIKDLYNAIPTWLKIIVFLIIVFVLASIINAILAEL